MTWRRLLVLVGVMVAGLACGAASATADPFAYATNTGDNTVSPIDTATNQPGNPIRVGTEPSAIAIPVPHRGRSS